MRVLLVDDHAVVRSGIRTILEDHLQPVHVEEASNGDEALAVLERAAAEAADAKPGGLDVIVLDLSMPGRSGIDLLVEIKHRHPKVPVLVLSFYAEEHFAVRALRAGASGYLTKTAAPDELVAAISKVCKGGRYVTEAVADRLAAGLGKQSGLLHEALSDREFDVLRGIASGQSVSELAAQLHLSVKTVSTYRSRLLEKMGMGSNAELTRYAITNGLV